MTAAVAAAPSPPLLYRVTKTSHGADSSGVNGGEMMMKAEPEPGQVRPTLH